MGQTRVILNRKLTIEPKKGTSPRQHHGRKKLSVILDNIRSAWNVGSILRSADGFGFEHAYCCGITPTPDNETVLKTSLGAEGAVRWSYHKDAVKLTEELKKDGIKVYAMEDDIRAVALNDSAITNEHGVLIMGSEVTGVDPELLDLCDRIFYIPMYGEKRSFNVAVAFGIAAYIMK